MSHLKKHKSRFTEEMRDFTLGFDSVKMPSIGRSFEDAESACLEWMDKYTEGYVYKGRYYPGNGEHRGRPKKSPATSHRDP